MDTSLYFRIQHYPLRRDLGQNFSALEMDYFLSCDISPLCDVTVKAMMLDHANHYILGPLASLTDRFLGLHQISYITPNMISASHVLVAIASAKCVSSDSLVTRRLGVALFELRSMLDDLDGHVARARKHIRGESSDVGSVGYYVDGLCDALGVTALLIGSLIFLKNNPPRRGLYLLLPTFSTPSSEKEFSDQYRTKVTSKKVMHKLGCFGTQLLLSSIAWNRYIALYQEILERTDVTPVQAINQIKMIRSTLMWTVSWTWRLFNPHAIIDVMLVAIFCDKLWEYLRAVQYMGFIVLLSLVCISEMHISEVQGFVLRTANHTIVP